MPRLIDVMHLGNDRVIGANELPGGLIIDPGPATGIGNLIEGLAEEPTALLLTHIHLDHAGASGVLCRRFPALRVYVHERGARHMADPSKLLVSAERLYGDDMERLWGEVGPVPEDRIETLGEGGEAAGLRYAYVPGHASHHVAYLDESTGDAYVGDTGGVRIPPASITVPPTPPPDIDIEAWMDSLDRIEAWGPERLNLTHFGAYPAGEQLAAAREVIAKAAAVAHGGEAAFMSYHEGLLAAADAGIQDRARQAVPPDQAWLGLERYWRKRDEAREE